MYISARHVRRMLLVILVVTLQFSARYRFGAAYRPGGAELSVAPMDFPLIALLMLWGLEIVSRGTIRHIRLTMVEKAAILFMVAHIPSVFMAPDSIYALLEILRLGKMLILVAVLKHFIRDRDDLVLILHTLVVIVLMQALIAIAQSLLGRSLGLGFLGERETFWVISGGGLTFGRAGGTMGHANAMANFFEMLLPLILAFYLALQRSWWKTFSLWTLLCGLLGLLLTFSRAGWMAGLVGMGAVMAGSIAWSKGRQRVKQLSRLLVYVPILLITLAGIALIFGGTIIRRFEIFGTSSWDVRLITFEMAWRLFKSSPLIGVGANNYQNAAIPLVWTYSVKLEGAVAHNILLLILAETGLLGLSTFFFLVLAALLQARGLTRRGVFPESAIGLGIAAGIVALMVHAMFDWLLRYDPIFSLFWFLLGVVVASTNLAYARRREARQVIMQPEAGYQAGHA